MYNEDFNEFDDAVDSLQFGDGFGPVYAAIGENGAVYSADGDANKTPVLANQQTPRAIPIRQGQRLARPSQNNGKYLKLSVKNANSDDRSFYLFDTDDEKGLMVSEGDPFDAIEDATGDKSLTVTYFDDNVNAFIKKFRTSVSAMVSFMRLLCSNADASISGYTTVIETIQPGQSSFTRFLAIHNAGYSSEMAFKSNELTLDLVKRGQVFQLGATSSRIKMTAPGKSTLTVFLYIDNMLDPNKAYADGRLV